jgi:hypothetical protein
MAPQCRVDHLGQIVGWVVGLTIERAVAAVTTGHRRRKLLLHSAMSTDVSQLRTRSTKFFTLPA